MFMRLPLPTPPLLSHFNFFELVEEVFQGPVVQNPVNAKQGSRFSYSKEFSQQITGGGLKATQVKM